MPIDASLLFGFLLVFVRCSAMLLSSPVFGAQNTPVHIRVLTTLSISAALTAVLKPNLGAVPDNMGTFALAIGTKRSPVSY